MNEDVLYSIEYLKKYFENSALIEKELNLKHLNVIERWVREHLPPADNEEQPKLLG